MEELEALIKRFGGGQERGETEEKRAVVLFIDDDESMRRGLSRALSHKYEVLTAGSGREGLEVMEGGVVECVILDVKMREMNGFETYGKVKEKDPNVPIIFYTAFQSEHDLQDVINKYKPEGYVEKGRDVGFLEHLVDRAVEKYRLVKENEEYRKDLERKVREKTEALRDAHAAIVERERLLTETHIAGGMAHEIKNALGAAKLHLRTEVIDKMMAEIGQSLSVIINCAKDEHRVSSEVRLKIVTALRPLYENVKSVKVILERVTNSINRAFFITNRVLHYSRLGSEKEFQEIDVGSILKELVSTYRDDFRTKRIELHSLIDDGLFIKGSGSLLYTAFENLLLNAKDAVLQKNKEKKVIIRGQIDGEHVVVSVEDTGIGMSNENIERIFRPFFSTKQGTGIGIGLNECQKIVKQHGGTIAVSSKLNNGTIFQVTLPRSEYR